MKRVISILLVLVVVLGCVALAACGGGNGGAEVDNGGAETVNGDGGDDGGGNGGGDDLEDILGHGADINSVYYVMETSGPGMPTVSVQMWVEGNKMRMEMTEMGQYMVYLSNYDTGEAYMYLPDINMAMRVDMGEMSPPDYESAQDIPDYSPNVIGTMTEDGKVCLVVEYSYGGATVKSWIWKEYGFPIRVETTTAEGTVVVVFKDIDFSDIPDNKFELPAGVQIASYD